MLEPSIDALQEKINSKYTLVTLSARRARQMSETNKVLIDNPKSHKFVGMALEEVQADKLFITEE
ncbi:DNA-directed RNA polymerase subunit omega [Oceanobacillus sp. M65]|jgi:DNA-directed RNA polymerase subunit omega|uniref:DNA-directed RNA polymerase subunit omega n=1 Tax=Oceanobacillus jordanicus TaxID=2867266 RepID=A0AAW5B549_9BACI|nr:DNA-directed RNA polymerase subunit omega [Oceanobacillus jordanicus]AVQ98992.1 DNA-directed RNA polymerase subunit omega [Oceanobacillus iheyensis]MCG3419150.1 DNA-directed RNA polymerase subunit omega [Oceanobacillus jordanicus]NAP01143.1 DNA-directed RNA polymerase subunit omega [Halomonas sp. MG34]